MSLLPEWAPNVHPLLVHFPITLLVTAAFADLAALVVRKQAVVKHLATGLYLAGVALLLATYFTGRSAAATVLLPGMAHSVLNAHWTWAFRTAWYFVVFVLVRLIVLVTGRAGQTRIRLTLCVAGLLGLLLLFATAERGGELVYRHGVGVVGP